MSRIIFSLILTLTVAFLSACGGNSGETINLRTNSNQTDITVTGEIDYKLDGATTARALHMTCTDGEAWNLYFGKSTDSINIFFYDAAPTTGEYALAPTTSIEDASTVILVMGKFGEEQAIYGQSGGTMKIDLTDNLYSGTFDFTATRELLDGLEHNVTVKGTFSGLQMKSETYDQKCGL